MKFTFYLDPKFWTALVDVAVSLALYFVGKYGAPGLLEDMKFVIVTIQPIAAMLIVGMYQTQQAIVKMYSENSAPNLLPPSFMIRK